MKVLDSSTEEVDLLEDLQRRPSCPANHVIPCEFIRANNLKTIAIMPCLAAMPMLFDGPSRLGLVLGAFEQLLEVVTLVVGADSSDDLESCFQGFVDDVDSKEAAGSRDEDFASSRCNWHDDVFK